MTVEYINLQKIVKLLTNPRQQKESYLVKNEQVHQAWHPKMHSVILSVLTKDPEPKLHLHRGQMLPFNTMVQGS